MTDSPAPTATASQLFLAADLQDNLMTACNDLDQLQALLEHACQVLLEGFHAIAEQLDAQAASGQLSGQAAVPVQELLANSITALQFQDMASQLIDHTRRRLRSCADRLAAEFLGADEEGEAVVTPEPLRPNPVAQAHVAGGSVELF